MVKAVFDELDADEPKRRFTVGITDDVTHLSLPVDDDFDTEADGCDPGGVLRSGFGRHGEQQQGLDPHHR